MKKPTHFKCYKGPLSSWLESQRLGSQLSGQMYKCTIRFYFLQSVCILLQVRSHINALGKGVTGVLLGVMSLRGTTENTQGQSHLNATTVTGKLLLHYYVRGKPYSRDWQPWQSSCGKTTNHIMALGVVPVAVKVTQCFMNL